MGDASDAMLSLHPVTYKYRTGIDPTGTPQFGLVAEDVEKVSPDLVVHDPQHGIYTVRYDAVNAMLLNEFLKEHQTITAQQAALTEEEKTIAGQQQALQDLTARLERLERTSAQHN